MFCRNCGAELREGAKFCVKCGKPAPQNSATPNTTEAIPKTNPNPQGIQKPVSPAGQPNAGTTAQQPVRQNARTTAQQPMQVNNPVKKKSNVGLIVVIILLVIFILGVAGATLYVTVFNSTVIEELFNKEDKEDDTEGTEVTEDTENEGSEGKGNGTEAKDASGNAPAETTAEAKEESKPTEEDLVIKDQTYKVDIVPHGSVKFVPYAPANAGSDVVFKIKKKDQVVTVLPPFYENNSLAASGAVFVDVEEVFFKDYNIDGVEDIFVNCSYKYSADSNSTFMECRVFRGSAEGDYYAQKSLSKVGTEQAQANGTIGYYVDELRDLYANYDLPYSNSISYAREELEMLTEEQLMKARNEIYARHGYRFENPDLWKHFSNRDWYQPYTYTVPDSALNEHEIHNRDLILELEGNY